MRAINCYETRVLTQFAKFHLTKRARFLQSVNLYVKYISNCCLITYVAHNVETCVYIYAFVFVITFSLFAYSGLLRRPRSIKFYVVYVEVCHLMVFIVYPPFRVYACRHCTTGNTLINISGS